MTPSPMFLIALTLMLLHEMDAVRCREWRIFPALSRLSEPLGFRIFMLAHIPLMLALFWSLFYSDHTSAIILWLDGFFVVHVFLHFIFLWHKNNLFKDWISWSLIIGAGLFGILDIFTTT